MIENLSNNNIDKEVKFDIQSDKEKLNQLSINFDNLKLNLNNEEEKDKEEYNTPLRELDKLNDINRSEYRRKSLKKEEKSNNNIIIDYFDQYQQYNKEIKNNSSNTLNSSLSLLPLVSNQGMKNISNKTYSINSNEGQQQSPNYQGVDFFINQYNQNKQSENQSQTPINIKNNKPNFSTLFQFNQNDHNNKNDYTNINYPQEDSDEEKEDNNNNKPEMKQKSISYNLNNNFPNSFNNINDYIKFNNNFNNLSNFPFNFNQNFINNTNVNVNANPQYIMNNYQNAFQPQIINIPYNKGGYITNMQEKPENSNDLLTPNKYIFEKFGKRGWQCEMCNNFNFESRKKCNRCGIAMMPKIISNRNLSEKNSDDKRKKPLIERKGDWTCSRCKNLNFTFRLNCNRCHLAKQEIEQLKPFAFNQINSNIPGQFNSPNQFALQNLFTVNQIPFQQGRQNQFY